MYVPGLVTKGIIITSQYHSYCYHINNLICDIIFQRGKLTCRRETSTNSLYRVYCDKYVKLELTESDFMCNELFLYISPKGIEAITGIKSRKRKWKNTWILVYHYEESPLIDVLHTHLPCRWLELLENIETY